MVSAGYAILRDRAVGVIAGRRHRLLEVDRRLARDRLAALHPRCNHPALPILNISAGVRLIWPHLLRRRPQRMASRSGARLLSAPAPLPGLLSLACG